MEKKFYNSVFCISFFYKNRDCIMNSFIHFSAVINTKKIRVWKLSLAEFFRKLFRIMVENKAFYDVCKGISFNFIKRNGVTGVADIFHFIMLFVDCIKNCLVKNRYHVRMLMRINPDYLWGNNS